jgi:hypothetical protein
MATPVPCIFDPAESSGRFSTRGSNSLPQIARGTLTDPAPVDVEDELGAAMHQDDARIRDAQRDHQPVLPVLHKIVDDPSLQLERHKLDQKNRHGQQQEQQLMDCAGFQNIAEQVPRQACRAARNPGRGRLVAPLEFPGPGKVGVH